MNKRISILANDTTYIYNTRAALIEKLVELGYEVYIVSQILKFEKELKDMGCKVINMATGRHGKNPFSDLKLLKEYKRILKEINPEWKDHIHLSELVPHESKREIYEITVRDGGEGLLLKHIDSTYHLGKIDKNGKGVPSKVKASRRNGLTHSPWVKWKKYETYDCVIMGFEEASMEYKGNEIEDWVYWMNEDGDKLILSGVDKAVEYSHEMGMPVKPITKFYYYGWPGSIVFGQYDKEGNLVKVGNTSGITDELRKEFFEKPEEYIGRVVEVGTMERLKTGALREPRLIQIRPEWDKPAHECTID